MKSIAGVFVARADAERAARKLRSIGLTDEKITLLAPGTSERSIPRGGICRHGRNRAARDGKGYGGCNGCGSRNGRRVRAG